MKNLNLKARYFPHVLAVVSLVLPAIGYSAPGIIKERPLFLGFSVQPNIYFVVDDSGSMSWDVTKTTEANIHHPEKTYTVVYDVCWDHWKDRAKTKQQVPNCSGSRYELFRDSDKVKLYEGSSQTIDTSPDKLDLDYEIYDTEAFSRDYPHADKDGYRTDELLEWCVGYNATAYDPNQTYTPWVGYSDSTTSINSNFGYIPWIDKDNDDEYDPGECLAEFNPSSTDPGRKVTYAEMDSNERQNFRNWYTYYRKRQNVAKKAVSEVVADSETRMGLATINRGQYFAVKDMTVDSNKSALLSKVFSVVASGGTPLRSALDNAGKYYKGSSSPIQSEDEGGSCQQNYTILMTDGYWNSDSNWSGPGNFDGTSSNEHVRASDRDSYSNTLADVALKYYATDLKTSLANEVPTIDGVDENDAQHMVTFTVAFGVNGQIIPNSTESGRKTDADGMPLDPDSSFDWPKPYSNTDSTIDDVRHAAWNGRGLYLNAKNPQSLIDSLEASIDEIESRTGTASALAFNSTSYRTDSKFYYAQFTSGSWGGELVAQELGADLEAGDIHWKASEKLDALSPDSRNIMTYDAASKRAVPFDLNNLPTSHRADLKTLFDSDYAAAYQAKGKGETDFIKDAVDYLRGKRTLEGASESSFRNRSTVLGDIINSAPVYISTAASSWPDYIEPGYISYVRSTFTRTPMIYVGANDGMLHAFNASTGEEQFAYIPSGVVSTQSDRGLHYLIDKSYNHRYYVDATPAVADAYIGGQWKTLLIGGLGAGGKSLFAIDITDPDSITQASTDKVLWEVEINDLGLTYPKAKVAKMNDGSWVVLVANGYHNTRDGRAKILMLDIATGDLIKTFDTGFGSLTSGQCLDDCNGMSSVTLKDLDSNGTVDFIYAGDLKGNVWAINTKSTKSAEWVFDSQISYVNGIPQSYGGSSIDPVFVTEGRQPITTQLIAVDNPVVSDIKTWPNQLLFFGTGQFIAEGDHDSTDQEYVYAVMHANSKYDLSISSNSNLFVKRKIKQSSIIVDGEIMAVRSIEPENVSEAVFEYGYEVSAHGVQKKMGWYLPLPSSGERVIHDPLRASEYVIFNTLVPESDPCTFGASGFTMAISLLFGSNPEQPILDFNRDGEISEDDKDLAGYQLSSPPAGLTKLGNKGLGQSTFDEPVIEVFAPYNDSPSRISWEELK
jgi:type IV pilus assembly protein PilY1